MSWSEKYKRSINCENPKGFSQRAHCQGKKKKLSEQKLKPYKTVEQIAKKHRLDVSFIQRQLDMGEPIEHEHTKDHKLATEIALQHLDEIPDYYTRLKKMELDAKKHHNKFKDVKVNFDSAVKELERDLKKLSDTSYSSIDKLMHSLMKKHNMTAKELHDAFVKKHKKTPDDWISELKEGNLHQWFKGSKSKDGKPGWVNVVTGGTCASDEPGEGTPKCVSSSKRASMSKAERLSASIRKKAADPGQQQKTGSAKPTYVSTDSPKKKMNEETDKKGKGSGKKDACYNKVKSRYSVWPSAYASGALVKCRKVGASNWGNKNESTDALAYDWDTPINENEMRYCPKCEKMETYDQCKYGSKFWKLFSLPVKPSNGELILPFSIKKYDPNKPHPANEEKDHEHSMARSEISTIIAAAKRLRKKVKGEGNIEAWVQSKITKAADYLDSAADYVDSGEMKVENVSIEDANGKHYAEFIDIIKPEPLKPSKGLGSSLIGEAGISFDVTHSAADVRKAERSKKIYGLATGGVGGEKTEAQRRVVSAPSFMVKTADSYQPDGDSIDEKCWDGYKQLGMKKKGKKMVPNCVKEKYSNWRQELEEDWQSVNRKDKTDGLSQKAVNAYRRENPGSKLQTAVTEKNPKGKRASRRKSFCSRMSGMKSKLTSAKTARDPDSRINKALRRWNCN